MEWRLACCTFGDFTSLVPDLSQWPFGEEQIASSNSEHDWF